MIDLSGEGITMRFDIGPFELHISESTFARMRIHLRGKATIKAADIFEAFCLVKDADDKEAADRKAARDGH